MLLTGRVLRQFVEFLKTYLLILKYAPLYLFFFLNFLVLYLIEQNFIESFEGHLEYYFEVERTFHISLESILLAWGGFFKTKFLEYSPLEWFQGTYFLMDHLYEIVDNDPKIDWAERIFPLPFNHIYYSEYPKLFEDLTPYMDYLDYEEDFYPAFEFFKSYRFTNFRLKYYRPPYAIMPLRGCEYEDSVFEYFKLKRKRK